MNYQSRRTELMQQIGQGVMILVSPPEVIRSNDSHYDYRPSSDVVYVTGFTEPETIVVLAPGRPNPFTMFVRPRNAEREIWDGRRAGPEGAMEGYGADAAFNLEDFGAHLDLILRDAGDLYVNLGDDRAFDDQLLASIRRLSATRRSPDRAPQSIRRARPLLDRMRMRKSDEEIAQLERACALTASGHLLAMKATRPGMREYQLRALIEGHFFEAGARDVAYGSIIATGANACILHYRENASLMLDGQLVLVDAGAELDWYAGDITRTWPVGRTFTAPQRRVYQAVLDAQKAAVEDCQPGISNRELQQRTIRRLTGSMVELGLLKGDVDELIEAREHLRYYMHGVGHYLGLDVHDVGVYFDAEDQGHALQEGYVLTIEPGLYIPADDERVPEEYRGIGVRIEDDVVITADGARNLTSGVPKELDEIEAIRAEYL